MLHMMGLVHLFHQNCSKPPVLRLNNRIYMLLAGLYEERRIKNIFISNFSTLLHLVPQLRSPNRFPGVEFRAKFEFSTVN